MDVEFKTKLFTDNSDKLKTGETGMIVNSHYYNTSVIKDNEGYLVCLSNGFQGIRLKRNYEIKPIKFKLVEV